MKKIFLFLIFLFGFFYNQNSFGAFSNLGTYYYLPGGDKEFLSNSYNYVVGGFYSNLQKYYVIIRPSNNDNDGYIKVIDYANNLISDVIVDNNSSYTLSSIYNHLLNYKYFESSKYYIITIHHKTYDNIPHYSIIVINKHNFNIGYFDLDPRQSNQFYISSQINDDKFISYYNSGDTYYYDLTGSGLLSKKSIAGDIYKLDGSNKFNFFTCDYSYILSNNKVLCSNGSSIIKRYYWDDNYNEFQEDYISGISPDNYFFKGYEVLGDSAVYGINQDIKLNNVNNGTFNSVGSGFLNFIQGDISNNLKYYSIPGSLSGSYFDYQYLNNGHGFIEPLAGLSIINNNLKYSYFKFNSIVNNDIIKLDFLLEGGNIFDESNGELIIYESTFNSSNSLINGTGSIKDIQDLANSKVINDTIGLFSVILPYDPNLSINLPVLKLTNTFSIGYEEKQAELVPISDRLGKNEIQMGEITKKFFSFVLAVFYIIFRVGIIFLVFYLFYFFNKTVSGLSYRLFGISPSGLSGNLVGLSFYLAYLFLVFSFFLSLLSYIFDFLPFINSIINYVTVFFTFLNVSFFDYNVFVTVVNNFFLAVSGSFIFYSIYVLTLKFGRLN